MTAYRERGRGRRIREVVSRFQAGESIASLVRWLDEEEIRTVTGKQWRSPTVRNLLKSARNAGLREHQGQVIGNAQWPAIVTPEHHAQAVATLTAPNRRTDGSARRYLLSGLLRCGRCGTRMVTMSRTEYDGRRYLCRSGADFGGCGKVSITAPGVENLVYRAVLMRLDSREMPTPWPDATKPTPNAPSSASRSLATLSAWMT